MCRRKHRTPSDLVGPPQESLVRDETRISLPAKPSLTHAGPIVRLLQSLGSNPESLVAQLALRCSSLDHCATREANDNIFVTFTCLKHNICLVVVHNSILFSLDCVPLSCHSSGQLSRLCRCLILRRGRELPPHFVHGAGQTCFLCKQLVDQ
jgi:hypothetical protein